MNKINELILKLCPNGVEYKKLGEIATISRGGNFQKKDFCEKGIPCIHYGQIYTKYGLFADKTVTFINEECGQKQKYASKNDIVMAVTSENIEDVCKCLAWLGDEDVAISGHSAIIKHNQNPKYLVYYFYSQMFLTQKRKLAHGTKVIEVTPDTLKSIILPVPPLEVQREIVHILDYFMLLTTELTDKLIAEFTARKKQYEFYRDKLLSRDEKYPMKSLAELGKWSGGKTPSMSEKSFWEQGTVPWISSKDMKSSTLEDTQDHITEKAVKEASMTVYPANSIAVVTRSGILKHTFPVAYIPFETTINQDIKMLVVNEDILPRYAFHVIQGKGNDILVKTKKQGGTVDSLDFQKVLAYKVPVPSKDIQSKLVEVLDNFESICTDLNIGLPAEIEARQKQYEYYRDLLLTFAETGSMLMTDRQTDRQSLIKLLQYVFGYAVVKLSDIATITRGGNFQKKDFCEEGVPCIHYGQIYTYYGTSASKTITMITQTAADKSKFAEPNDIIMAVTSENIEDVCKCVAWTGKNKIAVSGHTAILHHNQNAKYLSYYFHTSMFFSQKQKYAHGTKVIEVTPDKLNDVIIPLPSIAEQNRIVDILNRFDILCNDIVDGLPAEIEQRQKQYEYYRDKLLSF